MRIKLIFILLCFVTATMFGCREPARNEITFAVGGSPNEVVFWEKLCLEFEQETGIKVNLHRQPTDTDQRRQGLIIPLQAKKSDPDVFLMDIAWIAQFAASGWLLPLSNDKSDGVRIDTEPFFKNIIQRADIYNGELIALPVYIDGGLLYYRKDLINDAGFENPPETWDDLVEISLKVQNEVRKKNPEFYAYVWQGAQYEGLVCNFIEFAESNRGGIIIADKQIKINTDENKTAIQFMKDLIHHHKISPPNTFTEMKEEEVRTFFQQGNAVFERNWPYAWGLHNSDDSQVKGKVGIAPLPRFKDGNHASTLGGWHIGISKYSDNTGASIKFINFVTSYQIQKRLTLELGWNPGRKDLYNDTEVLEKNPQFKELKDVFENAVPRPVIPYYTQISEIIQKRLNGFLSGRDSIDTVLNDIETEAQKIIDRYER
ncbi:MAG TPA: ABC transporter substrate-binding protein [Firmicutes bacterium]|nr:ABC transporter substrate-binding protein [Bacillota bacterium]